MRRARDIIEDIERLSIKDRRRVLRHLEQSLTRSRRHKPPLKRRPSGRGPYVALLELAGTAHSDHSDVSTDKYRHLAAAYADTHERR
jgi:hypothetical protein